MKYSRYILWIGLAFMIVLSFYLSYLIWASPANKDQSLTEETEESQTEDQEEIIAASEVFLPLKTVYLNDDEAQASNTESLLEELQTNIARSTFNSLDVQSYDSNEELAQQMELSNGIEMDYATLFPLESYDEYFNMGLSFEESEDENFSFQIVQVDFENDQIRFINKRDRLLATADIQSSLSDIQEALQDDSIDWYDVVKDERFDYFTYFNEDPVELRKFSYIASSRPYTVFRDAFFTNPENLRSNEDTEDLNIYDGSESMSIGPDDQRVDFQGATSEEENFDKYTDSYQYIRRLGTSYGSIRFLDSLQNTVDYHIFVEGFPVFSDNDEGKFSVEFSGAGQDNQRSVEIQANLNMIRVPIPSDSEVEVPSGRTVLQDLYYVGADPDELTSLVVGYHWEDIEDTGVVDLEPKWYVQYDGTWYNSEDLTQQLQESEG
ncbi:YycH family regulatory protein [Tetragenococcus muriaticus]|uniref:YycH family protein n=1 Tax=Tetragenococcus muriaticus 3MR10-3 TaxID=1302648 RepID=A0A091CD54_9ENTE|nr:two-component system activity regulator YycH [Tetragenococcus muriaticus]KFN91488.1 YycH family protein [Tetragenococcus muriaticus 3MR10-3]